MVGGSWFWSWRLTIMGMEGLWYFRRGRYSFQNFLLQSIGFCVRGAAVLGGRGYRGRDANYHEPSSHVAALQADSKVHVYPGDFRGKDSCAGAASYVNDLCEGCVSRGRSQSSRGRMFILSVMALG
jgi:hypothetical protein